MLRSFLQRVPAWAWALVLLAPSLATGFLRDDWLLLWAALDPSTAPEGARGLFFRPVADAQWWIAARLAGEAPWGMHLLVFLTWGALLAAVDRWMQKWTAATRLERALALLVVAAHAALVETRLWAAAGNGVLAAALAAWGTWWIAKSTARARGLGALLLILGVLARADAMLWVLALAVERRGRALGVALVLGVAALLVSARATGFAFDPLSGGELLRRLVIPYGAPLGTTSTLLITAAVSLRAGWSWWRREDAAPRFAWSAAAAVAVAASCTPWSAAGRYLVVPVVAAAIGLAWIPSLWWRRSVLLALLLFHLPAAWGSGARDLLTVARLETSLARVVRQNADAIGSRIVVVDPPRVGWTGSAADLENVVSAALLREVRVQRRSAAPGDGAWLRYAEGRWVFTSEAADRRRQ